MFRVLYFSSCNTLHSKKNQLKKNRIEYRSSPSGRFILSFEIMPFLVLHLALISSLFSFFCCCQSLGANSDLFSLSSGPDDAATTYSFLTTPNDQDPVLDQQGPLFNNIEDPSANANTNENLFANDPNADGNLSSENLLSACSLDNNNNKNNGQPSKSKSKMRVRRDTSCPSNYYDLPDRIPRLPDIEEDLKEADGPDRQFVWLIDVDGVTVGADEPKYYCVPHAPLYSIPVCGSGVLSDRWWGNPPLYPRIDKCSLSKWHYLNSPKSPLSRSRQNGNQTDEMNFFL